MSSFFPRVSPLSCLRVSTNHRLVHDLESGDVKVERGGGGRVIWGVFREELTTETCDWHSKKGSYRNKYFTSSTYFTSLRTDRDIPEVFGGILIRPPDPTLKPPPILPSSYWGSILKLRKWYEKLGSSPHKMSKLKVHSRKIVSQRTSVFFQTFGDLIYLTVVKFPQDGLKLVI